MSRPALSRREATQRAEWARFQAGEFEMLNLGSSRKAKASHSAETPAKDNLRGAMTMKEIDDVRLDEDSADEALQEDLDDLDSNGDVGSSSSSFDDVLLCRKDSGVGVYSARVASGEDIFATATEYPPLSRLRNASAAFIDAAQSSFPRLVHLRPPVESEDESIPQPALKAFIEARKHRRRAITPNTREQTKRAIRQQMAQPIPKLSKLNMQHFDDQSYTPPVNFVPGSNEARQWITRMCDRYAYKRSSYTRYQQEIEGILAFVAGRSAPARITASREYKRIVWLQQQLSLLLNDITAFMASFAQYIDHHEAACNVAERQAKEDAEHFTFCLSILQHHYEKHGKTYAGVDEKVARWNDGFKFLQTESPWEHPETHTWEGWMWESWHPELFKSGLDAKVEIAKIADRDDIGESLVDDLGEMMSNMVIGV